MYLQGCMFRTICMHHEDAIHMHTFYLHCHVKSITVVCICMHAYLNLHGVQRVNYILQNLWYNVTSSLLLMYFCMLLTYWIPLHYTCSL